MRKIHSELLLRCSQSLISKIFQDTYIYIVSDLKHNNQVNQSIHVSVCPSQMIAGCPGCPGTSHIIPADAAVRVSSEVQRN